METQTKKSRIFHFEACEPLEELKEGNHLTIFNKMPAPCAKCGVEIGKDVKVTFIPAYFNPKKLTTQPGTASGDYVTREEFLQLKENMENSLALLRTSVQNLARRLQ